MIDRISLPTLGQLHTDGCVTGGGAVEGKQKLAHLCDGRDKEGAAKKGHASLGDQTWV